MQTAQANNVSEILKLRELIFFFFNFYLSYLFTSYFYFCLKQSKQI